MNNPNTIENQVLTILKENTDARNDDMKLYLLVCNRCYQRYENQDIGGLPFAVIMNCYKELHLPHFESVRRSRAKLQASHPELAPSPEVQRGRKRCEQMCRHSVMTVPLPYFPHLKLSTKTVNLNARQICSLSVQSNRINQ